MNEKKSSPDRIVYAPIGVIHSGHTVSEETPIQPVYARGCSGRVEVFSEYADGLKDLGGFSHVILLYHFHRAQGSRLTVKPFMDDAFRGVFSTRHPQRANAIGLSMVRLVRVEGTTLYVEDVDILDGTPLLDIKPYIPRFDHVENARGGWTEEVDENTACRRGRGMRTKPQGWLSFFLMSLVFRLRDFRHPPLKLLQEVGVTRGQTVLDFGCGPGSFSVAAAQIAGPEGKVYAVDLNPRALAAVRRVARKNQLPTVVPLLPQDLGALPDADIDVAILYDVLHDLADPPKVLAELHRLLRPGGLLTASDHHMSEAGLVSTIVSGGGFDLLCACFHYTGVYCFRRANILVCTA